MKRQTKYQEGLHLRMSAGDLRRLEAIAERERANISVVARRFIAEGLDRLEAKSGGYTLAQGGPKAKRLKRREKKP